MKLKYILTMMLISHTANADTNAEALTKLSGCVDLYKNATQRIEEMSEYWFTNEESALNVVTNFQFISGKSDELKEKVVAFVNKPYKKAENQEDLVQVIEKSFEANHQLLNLIHSQSVSEDNFNYSLVQIESGLEEVGSEIKFANTECAQILSERSDQIDTEQFKKILVSLSDWRIRIKDMRNYLNDSSKKTWLLLMAGTAYNRIAAHEDFARQISKPVDELRSEVGKILAASQLYNRIKLWWQRVALDPGLARGNMTRYLQFAAAKRYLILDLADLKEFETELSDIGIGYESIKAIIAADLKSIRKSLADASNKLEVEGRSYFYTRQLLLSQRRVELGEAVGKECLELASVFVQTSNQELNETIYLQLEQNFLSQTDICQRRR